MYEGESLTWNLRPRNCDCGLLLWLYSSMAVLR